MVGRDTWLTQLRVAGDDAPTVESLLADGAPADGLQHAGQAVLRCSPSAGLIETATTLIESLSGRRWSGDPELIAELEHFRGRTNSGLSILPGALDEVGEALDQSPASESCIDLPNGTLWPGAMFDVGQGPEDFDADNSDRWLPVVGTGAKVAYAVMGRSSRPSTALDSRRDCWRRSAGRVPFDAFRKNSAAMTTSTPAGIGSVTVPDLATPERGSPITAIDPPADPSEDGWRERARTTQFSVPQSARDCILIEFDASTRTVLSGGVAERMS